MLGRIDAGRERACRERGPVERAARVEIARRKTDRGPHIAQEVEEVGGVVSRHLVLAVERSDDPLERTPVEIEEHVRVERADLRPVADRAEEIGSATCREEVCRYG